MRQLLEPSGGPDGADGWRRSAEAQRPSDMFETLPVGLLLVGPAGSIGSINAEAERLLQVSRRDVLGLRIDRVPVLPDTVRSKLATALNAPVGRQSGEAYVHGQRIGYVVERTASGRGATLTLYTYPGESRAADFLSVASHELKTPLTAIKGGAQLLERRLTNQGMLSDREEALLDMISSQVNRLTDMVEEMLESSRLTTGRVPLSLQAADLAAILDDAANEYCLEHEDRTISLNLPGSRVPVQCDPARIAQVARVLLRVAGKDREAGEELRVELSVRNHEAYVSIDCGGAGDWSAESDGSDEQGLPVAAGGVGLGLYLASEIVRLHGGQLWAEGEAVSYCAFRFTLPLHT